jgi:hypothetical protein
MSTRGEKCRARSPQVKGDGASIVLQGSESELGSHGVQFGHGSIRIGAGTADLSPCDHAEDRHDPQNHEGVQQQNVTAGHGGRWYAWFSRTT